MGKKNLSLDHMLNYSHWGVLKKFQISDFTTKVEIANDASAIPQKAFHLEDEKCPFESP